MTEQHLHLHEGPKQTVIVPRNQPSHWLEKFVLAAGLWIIGFALFVAVVTLWWLILPLGAVAYVVYYAQKHQKPSTDVARRE